MKHEEDKELYVKYEVDGEIAFITLNDPEHRNVLSRPLREQLRSAFEQFAQDTAKVAILTGAGDKAFCAGADLKEIADEGTGVPGRYYVPMLNRNIWVDKPVIAAVNGDAIGGGFMLVQNCDLAIAADHARFGMPEARWGRGAPWSVSLSWMIPQRIWMEMLLTGNLITAQRAYEVGFINLVVPLSNLMDAAKSMARQIADNAPLTVQASRKMVYLTMEMGRTAAWDVADALFEQVYKSEDAKEGPLAFKEKRKPQWKNR